MQMELHVPNPIQMQPVIQAAQTQATTYTGSASTGNQLHRQRKHRQPVIQAAQAQATSYTDSASTGNQLQRQRSTQQYFVVHSSISQYTVVLRRAQQYLVGQSSTSQYTVVLRSAVVRCSISEHLQFTIRCLAIRNQLPAVCYPQSAIRSQLPAVCYPQSAIPPPCGLVGGILQHFAPGGCFFSSSSISGSISNNATSTSSSVLVVVCF